MKSLVVEDDFTSRFLLQTILSLYGECLGAANGREALEAFQTARENDTPFDLICLDIMMPEMDGHEVLRQIRALEMKGETAPAKSGAKIIMTTALSDSESMKQAQRHYCDAYLVKPINKAKLLDLLKSFGLI
jgi:two-component system chemotaxis response regulator CheY